MLQIKLNTEKRGMTMISITVQIKTITIKSQEWGLSDCQINLAYI